MLTEKDIMAKLREGDSFAPLKATSWESDVPLSRLRTADTVVTLETSEGKSFRAVLEIRTRSTPKALIEACRILRECGNSQTVPMVVAPYIGAKQADLLAKEGISWIDLSGNMVIRAGSSGVYIERTGKPNRFPSTVPLRNVFRGAASLVSRALLLKPEGFKSLYEITDFIKQRNGSITVPTVSKALKVLQDELLVRQQRGRIWTIQREELLERLVQGYSTESKRMKGKTLRFSIESESPAWWKYLETGGVEYAFCGFYAAQKKGLGVTTEMAAFVKSIDQAKKAFEFPGCSVRPDSEFGRLILTEPAESAVWFNADKNLRMVDDLELYLEMRISSPRGPKIADMLRPRILGKE